jgi:hypothetical protein
MSVELVLRPWIGYDEVDPKRVSVSSKEQLMEEARALVGCAKDEAVKLYYCELNDAGLPKEKEQRVMIAGPENMRLAKEKGGGVVWVCVGGSPTTSPQKQKPRSPYLVPEFASVGFADLPELYSDSALLSLTDNLRGEAQDQVLLLMMAIPGSGKSRTVMSACAGAKICQVRIKFLDDALGVIRSRIRDVKGSMKYQEWKDLLSNVIKGLLNEKLGTIKGPCVVHIDDAQTLMGTSVVKREGWDGANEIGDPWDLVMPTLCSVLHSHLCEFAERRCVVSGTNFFAPLVLSTGSEAKTCHMVIDGTFPPKWVMSELVDKYFRIPESLRNEMVEHVTFLSGNRRAIQHFLVQLKLVVANKQSGDEFSALELCKVRNEAFSLWSYPILKALGGNPSSVAVQAVAALVFPEALSGRWEDSCIKFPLDKLPQSVKEFGLAGGLNLVIRDLEVVISVPRGCVWEFLSSLVAASFANRSSVIEVEAFVRVAQSVDIEKGHAFERLFACELTMMRRDGGGPLYAWIAKAWRGRGKLVPDPFVFGQPFVYESCIQDAKWASHQVYCVREEADAVKNRVVDVGFPMFLAEDNYPVKPVRIMCELKNGYKEAKLWRLCWVQRFFS